MNYETTGIDWSLTALMVVLALGAIALTLLAI
jgi:hypothetical protein